jgi:hypothetical protein
MEDVVRLLIPIMALAIPLVVVTSIFLVQPLVRVLTRLAETQSNRAGIGGDARTAELEQRLSQIERTLQRVVEEQDFHRQLRSGTPRPLTAENEPSPSKAR